MTALSMLLYANTDSQTVNFSKPDLKHADPTQDSVAEGVLSSCSRCEQSRALLPDQCIHPEWSLLPRFCISSFVAQVQGMLSSKHISRSGMQQPGAELL